MSKTKLKLFLILFVIVSLITTVVFATEAKTATEDEPVVTSQTDPENTEGIVSTDEIAEGDQVVSEDDIVSTDRYFAGDKVEISDIIDGNVFVIGKEVTITGEIGGDLFVIADKLTIDGAAIFGNVFGMASEINIDGAMYYAYLVCDKFNFEFNGYVYRDLYVEATEMKLNGRIIRNAYLEADKVTIDTNLEVYQDINYTAQSEAIYIEELEDGTTRETTTIPETVAAGNINYTNRSKKLFNKEIKRTVQSVLSSNKVSDNMNEDQIRKIFTSYALNNFNIKSSSENLKNTSNKILVSKAYFYVSIVIFVVLIIVGVFAIILPNINKSEKTKTKEKIAKKDEEN